MEKELQLEDLIKILRKNLAFIFVISVLMGIATFVVSNYFIEKRYESSALIYVESTQIKSDSVNINDINAAQKLVNTCQIIFKSDTMMDKIIDKLHLKYSRVQLSGMITAQSVNNTEVMKFTAESPNRMEAVAIVNTMLEFANEEFDRIIKSGSFEIVDSGQISVNPSFPNVRLFTVVGFAVGFFIAYAIAFIKEIFDVIIKHDDDLVKIYNIPLFAEVPDFESRVMSEKYAYQYGSEVSGQGTNPDESKKSKKRKITRKDTLLTDNTQFSVTEAYNAGRTNILFAAAPYEQKIIAYTSCNPKEGKSTTCINMSIAFAKAGLKTLLIDCDMRKPVVDNYFDFKNKKGLSSILGGFCSVGEAVNADVVPNLDIISSGEIPPNPSELLGSGAMKELLDASTKIYDYIFLDTPPINVVTDALLMSDKIAGIVFIVRENSTSHPDMQKAVSKISLANGRPLGIVKNFCYSGSKRYGGYNKRKGYGYGYGYSYGDNRGSAQSP